MMSTSILPLLPLLASAAQIATGNDPSNDVMAVFTDANMHANAAGFAMIAGYNASRTQSCPSKAFTMARSSKAVK